MSATDGASTSDFSPHTLLRSDDPRVRQAITVLNAVEDSPQSSIAEALQLVGSHPMASCIALRAAAIAEREVANDVEAMRYAIRAVEVAESHNDPVLLSEALMTRALCLVSSGRGADARQDADRSVACVRHLPHAMARALAQRGLTRQRLGDPGCTDDFDRALRELVRVGDRFYEAIVRLNRGTHHVYTGDAVGAQEDLSRAASIQSSLGNAKALGYAEFNLGFAASRAGNLPEALRLFTKAEANLREIGVDTSPAMIDHAEVLLMAGMVDTVVRLMERATPEIAARQPALGPEASLLLARAHLASGNLERAQEAAAQSRDSFYRQGRPGWAVLANAVRALAGLPLAEVGTTEADRIADETAAKGWPDVAVQVRAASALRAAEDGDLQLAELLLAGLGDHQDDLPLAPQLGISRAHMAVSERRGDTTAVLEHAVKALAHLEERRVLLGASELRTSVTWLVHDILSVATLAALELGDLEVATDWVDRARSQALDQPPVVPPDDEQMADDLARLRVLGDQISRMRAEGEAVTDLLVEKDELERRVRDRARTASGTGTDASTAGARQPGTTEVAYLDLGDHLAALVADDTGTRRVDLAVDRDTIVHELDALGFAMQRVGSARSPGRRRDLAARSLDHSLATLDDALVAPLGLGSDDRVVVSPTSVLFDVPWSGLPGLVDRPVAVAPALRLSRRPHRGDGGTATLLLEGPRLSHARAELDALAEVVADPRTVLGLEGTVAAAKEALPEVAIAHLACHGVFRADNPQFSSLELADGPMFVYDLESLPRVPELIVLSACQTGRSAVHVGDELLGVTASLLALGARTVVAALADVPDDLSALLMLAFHQHVRAGANPAEALAHARRTLLATRDEPAARLTAAAFVCLGAP